MAYIVALRFQLLSYCTWLLSKRDLHDKPFYACTQPIAAYSSKGHGLLAAGVLKVCRGWKGDVTPAHDGEESAPEEACRALVLHVVVED